MAEALGRDIEVAVVCGIEIVRGSDEGEYLARLRVFGGERRVAALIQLFVLGGTLGNGRFRLLLEIPVERRYDLHIGIVHGVLAIFFDEIFLRGHYEVRRLDAAHGFRLERYFFGDRGIELFLVIFFKLYIFWSMTFWRAKSSFTWLPQGE